VRSSPLISSWRW